MNFNPQSRMKKPVHYLKYNLYPEPDGRRLYKTLCGLVRETKSSNIKVTTDKDRVTCKQCKSKIK